VSYPSEQVRPTWPARHTRPRAGRIELWELEGMSEILTVDDLASGLKMSKAQVYNLCRARSVADQALKSAFALPQPNGLVAYRLRMAQTTMPFTGGHKA